MAKKYTDINIFPDKCKSEKVTDDGSEKLIRFTDPDNNQFLVIESSITKKYNYKHIFFTLHSESGPAIIRGSDVEYWFQNTKYPDKKSWEEIKLNL